MENLLIACDFDGTITRRDTLHLIVESYGTRNLWAAIEPRLRSGEVTLEQAMQEEFATVRASPEQVRELVLREAGMRAGFTAFVAWCAGAGHRLVVLSSGFRSVIDALLADWGVDGLEVVSHEAVFSSEGCRLVWADRGEPCAVCGRRCKRHDLGRRRDGRTLVYVGDGISDRCAARTADLIFARSDLARDLDLDGRSYLPFEDFSEIRRALEARASMAA